MIKKNLIATTLLVGFALMSGNRAVAQTSQVESDEDIKLFRKDVRSLKKQIIAANIDLTDTEAQQFWPIYDSTPRNWPRSPIRNMRCSKSTHSTTPL